jgi:hypothetical protein
MNPALNIAQQFLQQYYNTLMTNKMALIQFYTEASHMTYGIITCNQRWSIT